MDRKTNSTPSFIESDGLHFTKPFDVANYLNNYFIGKREQLAIIFMHKKNGNEGNALEI